MLKVLIVNNRLDVAGGAGTARKATTLARALARAGAEVELATLDLGLHAEEARADLAGLTLHRVPCRVPRWPVPVIAPTVLRQQVHRADVVLLLNHWTLISVVYARAARAAGRPYVMMPCGALHVFGRSVRLKRAFNAVAGREMVRQAAGWIATTASEVDSFAPYGVDPRGVTVIPNAVEYDETRHADPSRFRQAYGIDAPFILFMGRLASIKGPDLLLDAWARVAKGGRHHLLLAGAEGDAGGAVRAFLERHGETLRARWIGPIDRTATLDAYAAADALIVPSRLEAMSLVALEAGIGGCPVIATTTCGFPEIAGHGGLVVDPTVDGLGDALTRAMGWSVGEKTARGEQLRSYIQGAHTWNAVTPRYLEVLGLAAGSARSS